MQSTKSLKLGILILLLVALIIFSGCAGTAPPINHAPTIISAEITTTFVEAAYTYDVDAIDPDTGDILTYSLSVNPVGMDIDFTTGVITWTPSAAGSYYITVEVSDGELSDVQSFTITVIMISSEIKAFLGEWTAISPTRISKVKIHSSGNKIIIHEWRWGSEEHPEDYDWGEQVVEISDFFDGTLELNWTYSEWSRNQKIEMLANGVLKVFSKENNYAGDYSFTYTDYFYNPEDENSYIPSLPGVGLYQDDPEFINLVNTLNSPKKIGQYMEDNFNYKALSGPHSPYQTYLSKEGDCADHAVFACAIANFHGYECFYIIMNWTCGACHAIAVYNMGGYYTYSSNYLYFDQYFNSIEECVNHCASTYIGYIEGNLSSYETYSWDYYNYRTSHLF